VAFGAASKEFIFQSALTANNPDLISQTQLNAFGGSFQFGKTNTVQPPEQKKVEKKPKPSVFNSKVTQEKKVLDTGKVEEELQDKIKKKVAKDEVVSSPAKSITKKKKSKKKVKTIELAEKE